MSYRKLVLAFVLAVTGFWVAGAADAHIGGSYSGKDAQQNSEMRCEADPADPRIAPGQILFPTDTFSEMSPAYTLEGQTVCAEYAVDTGAKRDLDGDGNPDDFVVNVDQQTLENGLTARKGEEDPPGSGKFIWTFTFTVVNGGPQETLLFH